MTVDPVEAERGRAVSERLRERQAAINDSPAAAASRPDPLRRNANLIDSLGNSARRGGSAIANAPELLRQVLRDDAWREFVTQLDEHVAHDSFASFVTAPPLRGLGVDMDVMERIIAASGDADLSQQFRQVAGLPDADPEPRESALLAGVRNGAWLHEQRFPPLRYAVPGLIPEGMTLLVGPPKAGKSWAALDIGLAVASGGRALGSVIVGAPRPVLYLALEDGDRRLQQRCRVLLAEDEPIPDRLDYLTRIQPGSALTTIRAWLEAEKRDDPLILLDTLGKVMPPVSAGQGAYGHEYRVASALKRVTDDHPGSSLVVLHHDRKAAAEDFVDAVSGTHGIAGAADTIIVLSRPRNQDKGTLHVTGRDVHEAEYAVDLSRGSWVIAGGNLTAAAAEATSRRATTNLGDRSVEVYAVVSRHPDGISPADVATAAGIDAAQARVYLGRLVDSGRITRLGRGRYAPPPTTSVATVTSVTSSTVDVTEETEATGGTESPVDVAALLADQLGAKALPDGPEDVS